MKKGPSGNIYIYNNFYLKKNIFQIMYWKNIQKKN